MDRRAFIATVVSLLAAPLAAGAQVGPGPRRVGLLDSGSLAGRAPLWEAFRQGMRELGYVEGRTVIFEPRGADRKRDRLAALAQELVRLKPDVIVAASNPAAQAAVRATATIPIVTASGDLLVASLAPPGGDMTGVTTMSVELSAKRLDLARELIPGVSRVAIIWHVEGASFPSGGVVRQTEAAARALGGRLDVVGIHGPAGFDGAFSTIARKRPTVLLLAPSPLFFEERRRLAELALRHRLPAVFGQREYVETGGLVAYGANLPSLFRRAAWYVDRILKGAKPGDLPIEQPKDFELVVNQTTAKKLGLAIPPSILVRAEIIR